MNIEEICDNLRYWVKLNKPITRKQAEDTLDFILEQGNEITRLSIIIEDLENWLAKEYISGCYEELYRIGLQDSYDKLQELKGRNKE